ncbi:MAG: SDR family oxidoreductase, partial [Bdellovibrionales bacterium]|nr:SDR family oxidoreductase [Bdellovibrionales bacterium]
MSRTVQEPRVVVVTGGTAGVGRATVRYAAARGADVGIIARGQEGLEGARREVTALGRRAVAVSADVSDASAVERACQGIEDELGPIDVWINNAMVSVFAPTWEIEPNEFHRVIEVTLLGQVYGAQAALRRMRPRNRGTIVFVGSALAYRGIPLQSAYCAAKHGIQGFFDSLRTELMHEGSNVHTTMVQLSAFNTPQFDWVLSRLPKKPQPVPPIFQPEVAAEGIYWAACHRRREVCVGAPAVATIVG